VPVAFVRPGEGAVLQEAALRECCLQQLARFKVPERVVVVDDFPIVESANGAKVQKVYLREMAEALLCKERDQSTRAAIANTRSKTEEPS
jgi:fatty-acyl-CoA synthase